MALIDVEQVQEILGIPQSTAYKIIRDLNKKMEEEHGYYTIRGKIEKSFLLRSFGIPDEE